MLGVMIVGDDIVRALDALTWYYGVAESVSKWAELPHGDGDVPISAPAECDENDRLQMIWSLCVLLYGDHGTSPRYGWIEDTEGFRRFCRRITETWRWAMDEGERVEIP